MGPRHFPLTLTLLLCGHATTAAGQTTITSVSPQSVAAGGPVFTLKVFGTNIPPGALIVWTPRQAARPTFLLGSVVINSGEINALVAPYLTASPQTIDISLNVATTPDSLTFTIGGGAGGLTNFLVTPSIVRFVVDPRSPQAPAQKILSITSVIPGAQIPFTITTSPVAGGSSWVKFNQSSGVTPFALSASVDQALVPIGRPLLLATVKYPGSACSVNCSQNILFEAYNKPDVSTSPQLQGVSFFDLSKETVPLIVPSPLSGEVGISSKAAVGVPQPILFTATVLPETADVPCAPASCWLTVSYQTVVTSGTPWGKTPSIVTLKADPAKTSPPERTAWVDIKDDSGTKEDNIKVNILFPNSPTPDVQLGFDDSGTLTLTGQSGAVPVMATVPVKSNTSTPYKVTYFSVGGWLSGPASGTTPTPLNLSANVASLAPGTYLGNIIVTPTGGAPKGLAVTLTVTPPAIPVRALSQVANGAGWRTTIMLVNMDSVPAQYTLRFWDGTGAVLSLPLGARGNVHEFSDSIPANGSRILQTDGTAGTLAQGWAEVMTSNSLGGMAIFRQQIPGKPDSEAAVPLALASDKTLLIPYDVTPGYAMGVAIVNPSSTQATVVSVTYKDENGNEVATDSLPLLPRGQIPFDIAVRTPALKGRRGVAQFTSPDVPLTGLGLRFSPVGTFTSIEALRPGTTNSVRQIISQIADGTSWKTTIILANTGFGPANYVLRFWDVTGAPLTLPLGADGVRQEISGTINPNGARFLQTDGTAATLSQGWAELVTSDSIGGTAVFRQAVPNAPTSEGAVAIVSGASTVRRMVIPFDNTQGFSTGIAIVNSDPAKSASVTATFRDESGNTLLTEPIPLTSHGHIPFEVKTRYPALSTARGSVEFSDPSVELFGLGLRFSPLYSFTSLPAIFK